MSKRMLTLSVLMISMTACQAPTDSSSDTLEVARVQSQTLPEEELSPEETPIEEEPAPEPTPEEPIVEDPIEEEPPVVEEPAPEPEPTPEPNTAPTFDTQAQIYMSNEREAFVELGLASDADSDAFTFSIKKQYWCSFGKNWNREFAESVNGNIARIYFTSTKADYNGHFFIAAVTDERGAESLRLIELYWGGGAVFDIYFQEIPADFDTSTLCGGATVYND